MFRLPEIGQPKHSRYPARATANEAALKKGNPAGRACSRHGGKHTGHNILGGQWQAQDPETPLHLERRFECLARFCPACPVPAQTVPVDSLDSRRQVTRSGLASLNLSL